MTTPQVRRLPDYLGAIDGVTSDGTQTGSLLHAVGSFVLAAGAVALAVTMPTTTEEIPLVASSPELLDR